jgi:nitrite reductase/ring-hydroxylating ferredoxin subunit
VTDPLITRRRALTGAAVGGLALPVLTACGGGGDSSTPTAGDPPDTSSDGGKQPNDKSQDPAADSLVATADVPVGGGVILRSRNVVVTQPKEGQFEGFSATCTHEGCLLTTVASGTINCRCHGSQFAISDGSNVAGPNGTPAGSVAALPKIAVEVKGADVVPG